MTDFPAEAVDQDLGPSGSASEADDDARREALLADTPEEAAARAVEPVRTGNQTVDDVVASLEGLDGLPVDEHVARFEQAHEQLRRALSGAGDAAR